MFFLKPQASRQFSHHGLLEVWTMICHNLFGDFKTWNNMFKHENCRYIIVFREGGHGFDPFCEIVYHHYDVLVPSSWSRMARCEIKPPFFKWSNENNWMHRSWVSAHFLHEQLAWMEFFDFFNIVFEYGWPKVDNAKNLLDCFQLR